MGKLLEQQTPDAARTSEPRERVPELVCGLGTENVSGGTPYDPEDCLLEMVGPVAVRVDVASANEEARGRPVEQGVFELEACVIACVEGARLPTACSDITERCHWVGLTLAGGGSEHWATPARVNPGGDAPVEIRAAEIRAADQVRWPSSVSSGPGMMMTRERSKVVSAPCISAGGGSGKVRKNGGLRGSLAPDRRRMVGGGHVTEGMGELGILVGSSSGSLSLARRRQALETRV